VIDGRYVLRDRIGEGGMGCVFLADQPAMARTVAIKVLRPELVACPGHVRRMREEALVAQRVRSPHCVAVIESGVLPDGAPYVAMEHVAGRSLGRVIADEPIPLARAIDLLDQILRALAATHDAGIIHADVKSDNFLVERTPGGDHVTLIDFGLARLAASPGRVELEDGEVIVSGTPEYMAPEVIAGDPPVLASDLYGAGVILYELLTGATPFGGGTATEIMLRHAHDPLVPPSLRRLDRDIPHALDLVVLRALAKRPGARFPDAAAFARELRAAGGAPRMLLTVPQRCDDRSTPEAPTRTCTTPLSRRRGVRGGDGAVDRIADLHRLRSAIGQALARGDVAAIADGYVALGGALAAEGRGATAASELQEGIDILTAGRGPAAVAAAHPAARLATALAALREAADNRPAVRRAARTSYHGEAPVRELAGRRVASR
jgi:serine/threonine-protein kinase